MLQIKNLNAGYSDLLVLKDVSLELQPGTISILMGPNGAGKSTLIKSIYKPTTITSGQFFFQNENITHLPTHELLVRGMAFVPQGRVTFGTLTMKDNLLLGAFGIKNKQIIQERLEKIFNQFPILKEKSRAYAFTLSGGQQQMLAIGRTLMSMPKLMLMDEPSLGLAPKLVKEIFAEIKKLKETFGVTILIVEHNLKSLMDVADYGYVMVHGEIIAHDTCERLKQSDIMKKVFVGAFD